MNNDSNALPSGQVYVRPEVLYVDRQRVHLSDNAEHEIAPTDAALLELVYRGDSSFARLCARVAALDGSVQAEQVATNLAPVLRDPRSILDLRPSVPLASPEVIVCDFAENPHLGGSQRLVERLRRSFRVLHLGLERHVHGEWPWNATLAAAIRAGTHESWYDFAQWCRGVIAENDTAVLVLCGHQDTILFGDLASRLRTLVLLDPKWPALVGVGDMLGADWVPDDPYDMVRDLYYALRFASLEDLDAMNRTCGSSFARLEGYALRHAVGVAHVMTDQPAALASLGRSDEGHRLVHAAPVRALRRLRSGGGRALLIVAGIERGIAPIAPFLHLVRAALETGRLQQIFLVTADAWFELRFEGDVAQVLAIGRGRPHPTMCLGAVIFPGLLRDCRPACEVMAKGVPSALIPSRQPHPLDAMVAPQAILRATTVASFHAWLDRLADADDALSRELVTAQARALRRHDVVRFVAEAVATQRGASAELSR